MPVGADLYLDYETASVVNLRTAGAYVYAAHRSTRILMLSWAFGDEPVQLWEPHICAIPPERLVRGLLDPGVICKAANAPFERLITYYKLGIEVPYERWRCVLVKAYYLGFAGGLDQILEQVGLRKKDPRGQRLINKFCSPAPKNHKVDWYDWKNSPEDWQAFGEYCVQDSEVERDLDHWLDQFPGMLDLDWYQWFIDQRINDRGVPLDVEFAEEAIALWYIERERLDGELRRQTGLPKATREPVLEYFNNQLQAAGCRPLTSMAKDYITSRLKNHHDSNGNPIPPHVESLILLWQEKEAKAATKYTAVSHCVSSDGRARGMFQYKGASRTDRAGGRRLQLQNLKHPLVEEPEEIERLVGLVKQRDTQSLQHHFKTGISEILGGAVRHVITAPPGKTLCVADLTSIESVLLGWLTNCETINETFRAGRDSYKVFGSKYYGVPYDAVTKEQRSFSKPPVLGCGYMLGWVGLMAYAEGYGVKMTEEQARRAVETFRGMYPEVKRFWYWLYDSIKFVTITGKPLEGYRLHIERDEMFLRIRLPSGRNLSYFKPEIKPMPAPWDYSQTIENFTYMGMDDNRQWVRDSAHAGGVTENIVQSIAWDILQVGIVNSYHAGLDVILQVHDELAVESYTERAEQDLQTLKACMVTRPDWAPDLWLGASGFITKRYTKD